ncbi:MAG: lipid A export permease/ATP-binding protein MsbA [Pseudomonadota bacterium]
MNELDRQYSPGTVYWRLLGYTSRYRLVFYVAIVGMVISAAANALFVQQIEPLVEDVFVSRDSEAVVWVPLMIFAMVAMRAFGTIIGDYGMNYVAQSIMRDLRGELFEKYLVTPAALHDVESSGNALSKVIYNVSQLSTAASRAISIIFREGLTALGLLYVMISVSPKLSLVFFAVVPMMFLFVSAGNKAVRRYSRRIQDSMGDVARVVGEIVSAHRTVKIFGGEGSERRRFGTVNHYNRRQELKLGLVKSLVSPFVQLLVGASLAAIVYVAASDLLGEPLTAGAFMTFFFATGGLFAPLRSLTKVNMDIQKGVTAAQAVFEVFDADSERDEGELEIERARGEIEFRDVSFRYQTGSDPVLSHIDLHIQPGQTVALVGRSGSGKTTLASLLPRFYDLDEHEGEILVDGVPIETYRMRDLRRQISYVGQDLVLFDDSLRNNIAYGELGECSEEQLRDAVEAAHADRFIDQMEGGLDTGVGEGGNRLSGGQRQRVAIARALLKNAPILILDEATSALDSQSERHIQAALDELVQNRTTLVIAHRLSTIEQADLIVVMDDGKIVEKGRHSELLARGGAYAELYRNQFGEQDK